MGFDVSISGMKNVERLFRRVRQRISDVNELNSRRADSFMRFTRFEASTRSLKLQSNTSATRVIQRANHPPLLMSGAFASSMRKRRNPDNSFDAGFLKSNMAKPRTRTDWAGWTLRSRLTFTQIANIQKTGYRIPVAIGTVKGKKVRAFLSAHDIHLRRDKKVLVVVPRDMIGQAIKFYRDKPIDLQLVKKHVNAALAKGAG